MFWLALFSALSTKFDNESILFVSFPIFPLFSSINESTLMVTVSIFSLFISILSPCFSIISLLLSIFSLLRSIFSLLLSTWDLFCSTFCLFSSKTSSSRFNRSLILSILSLFTSRSFSIFWNLPSISFSLKCPELSSMRSFINENNLSIPSSAVSNRWLIFFDCQTCPKCSPGVTGREFDRVSGRDPNWDVGLSSSLPSL